MPACTQGRHIQRMPEVCTSAVANPRLPAHAGPGLMRHGGQAGLRRWWRRSPHNPRVHTGSGASNQGAPGQELLRTRVTIWTRSVTGDGQKRRKSLDNALDSAALVEPAC